MADAAAKTDTAKLQIEFQGEQYKNIIAAATEENNRMGLVKRKEKIHTYQMVPVLIDQGLLFRKGHVYVPEDKRKLFMKNEKFSKLLAKAQLAMEDFKAYQDELLSGG